VKDEAEKGPRFFLDGRQGMVLQLGGWARG